MQNKYIESNELNPHRNAYSPYLAAVPFKQAIYARLGRHNCAVIAFSPAPSSAVAAKTPAELLQIGRVLLISLICCFDEEDTRAAFLEVFYQPKRPLSYLDAHHNMTGVSDRSEDRYWLLYVASLQFSLKHLA